MKIQDKINAQQKILDDLLNIAKIDDTVEFFTRKRTEQAISSKLELMNDVYLHFSCGCCDDTPLKASLYYMIGETTVYFKDEFYVGQKDDNKIKNLDFNALDHLLKQGLLEKVVCSFKNKLQEMNIQYNNCEETEEIE